jgi:hypothetical protein
MLQKYKITEIVSFVAKNNFFLSDYLLVNYCGYCFTNQITNEIDACGLTAIITQ